MNDFTVNALILAGVVGGLAFIFDWASYRTRATPAHEFTHNFMPDVTEFAEDADLPPGA